LIQIYIEIKKMFRISIVIPVYNEQETIRELYNELKELNKNFEFIFVDDGSTDTSLTTIKELAKKDVNVNYISFSRNFGKEIATSAGLHHVNGQAAVIIDADLQHPPETINKFIDKWEQGNDMVIGVRDANVGESLIRKLGAIFYYKLINLISETKIKPHSTDFRLIDKKIIKEFNKLTEKQRITRGLLNWIGFNKAYVNFQARPRKSGQPGYSYLKLAKLALSSFVSNSLLPLKLAGYLGIFIILISGTIGLFMLVTQYLYPAWSFNFSGPAQLAVLIIFFIGIVLSCLGLIALYIGNIQREVINRPMYIIKERSKNL